MFCPSVSAAPSQAQFRLNNAGVVVEGDQLAEEAGLDEIFDIRLGQPPRAAVEALSGTVLTIGFERGGQRVALFIGGSESTLAESADYCSDSRSNWVVQCRRRCKRRARDPAFELGELRVTPGKVGCTGSRQPLNVDLETAAVVSRSDGTTGRRELAVDLRYVRQGVVVGVDLSLNPPRKLNLLGRYLRRSYGGLRQELRELAPPPPVVRTLTRLYTHGGRTDSKSVRHRNRRPAALLAG